MTLDDDDEPPTRAALAEVYGAWRAHGGRRLVGATGRGVPVKLATSAVGRAPLCEPIYAYTGAKVCDGPDAWFVTPNAMVFDAALAESFMDARAHAPLHAFVRKHWVHPDDIAFGAFGARARKASRRG